MKLTAAVDDARLGGEDAVVDLATEARRPRLDAQPLQVGVVQLLGAVGRRRVDDLVPRRAEVVARDRDAVRRYRRSLAEPDVGVVLLELDLGPGREPGAQELRPYHLPERRLRQEQEVVLRAAHDPQRGDYASLRRQQQRIAHVAKCQRLDVVRDHPLEELPGLRSRNAHEGSGPRPDRDACGNTRHAT